MNELIVYTDGACSGNPGPGGWAALLLLENGMKRLSSGAPRTTNNRMELTAALEALRALDPDTAERVKLHTDSAYLANAFNQHWIDGWQKNGWKNSSKNPVANKDLWQALLKETAHHEVEWIKVKGHADDPLNIEADELAVAAMERFK